MNAPQGNDARILDLEALLAPISEEAPTGVDLREDPVERNNLLEEKPEIAKQLEEGLRDWQQSVLNSLTGADYR